MHSLKEKLLFAFIFLASFTTLNAQSLKDRIIIGHGFSVYTDFFDGPDGIRKYEYSGEELQTNVSKTVIGASIVTYTLNSRFILAEISKNNSVSLDLPVSLGLSFYGDGVGSLMVPAMISFNHGNVSGYSSDKDKGVVIGVGAQYVKGALAGLSSELKSSWIEPCMNIGYRYWNKRNKAKELNLKIGYNPGSTFTDTQGITGNTGSFSIKLAFIIYPKY